MPLLVGFEAVDILLGNDIVDQIIRDSLKLQICIPVLYQRRILTHSLVDHWPTHDDSVWRGIGIVPASGMVLRDEHGKFAEEKYQSTFLKANHPRDVPVGKC